VIARAIVIRAPIHPTCSWLCDGSKRWCDRAAVYELSIRINGKKEVFARYCDGCYGSLGGPFEAPMGVRRVA